MREAKGEREGEKREPGKHEADISCAANWRYRVSQRTPCRGEGKAARSRSERQA